MTTDDLFGPSQAELTEFAHNSEHEFARLLDFYDIEWQYEPHAFALEWDDSGEATRYFRPDFYLPEDDVYIEITTMSQKLVTKKNRKVRLLKEHHPHIKCKVFYQRDYLNLLVKYGLEEPDAEVETSTPTRIPGPPEIVDLGTQVNG